MGDIIANWLISSFPGMVRVIGGMSPVQALLMTAAILAVLVICYTCLQRAVNGNSAPRRPVAARKMLIIDAEVYDAEWMDYYKWLESRSEYERRRAQERS